MDNSANNTRIAKNTFYLYCRTFISIIVTLYTSRVFLQQLGIEDYGIYNLVGGVVALFTVLNSLMASAIQRFLSIEIGNKDIPQLYKILNISITLHIILFVFVLLLGEIGGLLLLKYYLVIPDGKQQITYTVFHISIITAAIGLAKIPYNALIVAYERMSFYAYVTILEVVAKLGITLSLVFVSDKLITFSVLQLFVVSGVVFLFIAYCYKYIGLPKFRIFSPRRNSEYKSILSFSTWSLVGNLTSVARDQGLSFLLNRFYGIALNAAMGIVIQISNVYSGLFLNLQSAFRPQVIQNSVCNKVRYQKLLNACSFYSLALMGLVCLPMILACRTILTFWLGDVPDYSVEFVQILMLKILFASISQCIFMSLEAYSKINTSQIATALLSMASLVLIYTVLRWGYEPYYVMCVIVLMEFLILSYRLYYASYKGCIELMQYLRYNYKIFILNLILSIVCIFFSSEGVAPLYEAFRIGILLIMYIVCLLLCMEKEQRYILINKIKQKRNEKTSYFY